MHFGYLYANLYASYYLEHMGGISLERYFDASICYIYGGLHYNASIFLFQKTGIFSAAPIFKTILKYLKKYFKVFENYTDYSHTQSEYTLKISKPQYFQKYLKSISKGKGRSDMDGSKKRSRLSPPIYWLKITPITLTLSLNTH